jgi:hypothetical protein
MNMPDVLVLLLLGHVLGDFYFQCNGMVKKKKQPCLEGCIWTLLHGAIYAAALALVLPIGIECSPELWCVLAVVAGLHLAVDFFKWWIFSSNDFVKRCIQHRIEKCRKTKEKPSEEEKLKLTRWLFIGDQLIHLFLIVLVGCTCGDALVVRDFVTCTVEPFEFSWPLLALGLLTVLRPVGKLIKEVNIWNLSNTKTRRDEEQQGAGRIVGYLERLIVFFLVLFGQYEAIGFVIAAKAVIRFPEISGGRKNKKGGRKTPGQVRAQAEYFLIGTFLSFASVFAVLFLLGLIRVGTGT